MDGGMKQCVDICLCGPGTLGVTWFVERRLRDHVGSFGVRTFQHVNTADVGFVEFDSVTREQTLRARVVNQVAIVMGIVADKNAEL